MGGAVESLAPSLDGPASVKNENPNPVSSRAHARGVEAIHSTSRIARVLGITRSAAKRLVETQTIRTYEAWGRTCVSAEELDRYDRSETGVDRWEGEGGSIR